MSNEEVSVLLVGAGGYAKNYIGWLSDEKRNAKIVGIVDPVKEEVPVPQLWFPSIEAFYENNHADLAIISTPIYLHKDHTLVALSHGSNVLCEKPIAGCLEDALEMSAAAKKYDRFLAIGFQLSYHPAIHRVKKDIQAGVWGKPTKLKTMVLWPRGIKYYKSRNWSGKQTINGRKVMDSIAHNAMAHYLHNMLFVLGDKLNTTADFTKVNSSLYRLNDIETFDTCEIEIETADNARLALFASHTTKNTLNPIFEYQFENGIIRGGTGENIIGTLNSGETIDYGSFDVIAGASLDTVLPACIDKNIVIPCTVETAMTHMRVMEEVNKNISQAKKFAKEEIETAYNDLRGDFYYIPWLEEKLHEAYLNY